MTFATPGLRLLLFALLVLFGVVGCQADRAAVTGPAPTQESLALASAGGRYVVMAAGNALPRNFDAAIAAAGGTLTHPMPEIGIAVAASDDPGFAAKAARIAGVRAVFPDYEVEWVPPARTEELEEETGNPPFTGDNDAFLNLQWGMDAIDAIEAFDAGYRGAGVRVFILDSGIRSTHLDLAPNLNAALSTSFVEAPAETYNTPPGFHGTHVTGIVAAADNGIGTIGVASEAEIVAVKVLRAATGSGAISWGLSGLHYAANNGADVVNMSFGATFSKRGIFYSSMGPVDIPAKDVAHIVAAWNRVTTHAHQKGVTLVAAAGNDAIDGDHSADLVHLPSDAAHVIAVAATGPMGWALDFGTDLDRPASYTNFGRSAIDFAAPGGDFALPGTALCTVPAAPFMITTQCWVFDLVLSTSNSSNTAYAWTAGTSMAAPHVSGVAALVIGAHGGSLNPAHVESILQSSADHPGSTGSDPFYGGGRVNAAAAVGAD